MSLQRPHKVFLLNKFRFIQQIKHEYKIVQHMNQVVVVLDGLLKAVEGDFMVDFALIFLFDEAKQNNFYDIFVNNINFM